MSNYNRPIITYGNSFYINIELKQFNKDSGEYEYFDITTCHDVKVNLICAQHNTVIPLQWELLEGFNYILKCFVDYRLLHTTSYGVMVEGLNADNMHWRWTMLPKEGLLVVNNTSGMNIPDDVTTVDLAGRVGWGIQTDADLTNYYTKTEVNTLLENVEVDLDDYYTKSEVNDLIDDTESIIADNYYDKTEVDGKFDDYYDKTAVDNLLDDKQETLESGVNIKTINGESILGEGNITISGGGGGTQVQSDWNETDTTSPAYIQNKPDITSIEGSISDVQNDIDDLEDDIAAQQLEISGIQSNVSGIQSVVSGHQTVIQNQSNEISGIQANISGIQSDINGIQTVVSGHQTVIQNQNSEISGIQSDIANIQSAVENLDTEKQDALESGVNIKTINNESILGEGNITIESGADIEPAKIVVTDEEVQNPEEDAVYIVQKPINLKTINGEEIVGEGNIEVEADTSEIEEQLSGIQSAIHNQANEISGMQTVLAGHQTALENQSGVEPGFIKATNPNYSTKIGLVSSLTTNYNTNIGNGAIIEGIGDSRSIEASGEYSHAEGCGTQSTGQYAHAEGNHTQAFGAYSHAEGYGTVASRPSTHAEGLSSQANGMYSHAEGWGTRANNVVEHASGQFNLSPVVAELVFIGDATTILSSVGNGTSNSSRHNAFEVRQNGDIYYADTEKIDGDTVHYYDAPMIKLQDAIGGVQTAISGHQTALESQATEMSGMQTNISGMQTSIAGYQTALESQATQISGMQTVLTGHQTALENQSGGGEPIYYVKLNWLSYPQDSSWQGNQAIEFQSLEVWDLTSSTRVYNAYFRAKDPAVVFSEIASQFAIRCNLKIDNVSADISNLTFTSWNGYKWLYIPQTAGGTTLGNGSTLQFDFYVTESSSSWTQTGICNTVLIPIGPCKNRMVTSTTSGLKIEVVSALPASPSNDTIYIIQ